MEKLIINTKFHTCFLLIVLSVKILIIFPAQKLIDISPYKAEFIFSPFVANLEKHRVVVVARKWGWRGNAYATVSTCRRKSAFKFAICMRRPDALTSILWLKWNGWTLNVWEDISNTHIYKRTRSVLYFQRKSKRERERERGGDGRGGKECVNVVQMGRRGVANFIECEFARPTLFPVINLVARGTMNSREDVCLDVVVSSLYRSSYLLHVSLRYQRLTRYQHEHTNCNEL